MQESAPNGPELETAGELSAALVVRAIQRQRKPVNVAARELRVPRSSVLSVLAGNARAGTLALVAERARELGWLSGEAAGA
jgi:hypothetical protein